MNDSEFVLLCYHSVEADFALTLATDLKNAGVPLWMDRLDADPQQDWITSLRDAMETCRVFLPILSPDYVSSDYGQRELQYANAVSRSIIPILLRSVPAASWPLEIGYEKHEDFSDWHNTEIYETRVQQLLSRLGQHVVIKGFVNPEVRHLNQLMLRIERHKTLLEYVRLAFQSRNAGGKVEEVFRPKPNVEATWGLNGPFVLLDEGLNRTQTLDGFQQALDTYPRFVLIGAQGVGKTTTLHRLARDHVRRRLDNPRTEPIPLLLDCAEWQGEISFSDFIRAKWTFQSDPMNLLAEGSLCLYLDGLSEMGQDGQSKITELRDWLDTATDLTHLIITCETAASDLTLKLGLPLVGLERMSESLSRDFALQYLGVEAGSDLLRRMFPSDAETIPPYWHDVVRNRFLMRSMMYVYQHSPDAELPLSIPALLNRMVLLHWEREQVLANPDWVPPEELLLLLGDLAFQMIDQGMPDSVHSQVALQHLGTSGLLQALEMASILVRQGDYLRFMHPFVQDVIAAVRLEPVLHEKLTRPIFDENGQRISTRWDSVVVALTTITDHPDNLIQNIATVDPFLAMDCIVSGQHISPDARKEVVTRLVFFAGVTDSAGLQAAGAQINRVAGVDSISILLDLMRDQSWELREAASRVLREVQTDVSNELVDTFQSWSWNRDEDDNIIVALKRIGDDAIPVLLNLLEDEDWNRRCGAAWVLGGLQDRAAVPGLLRALNDPQAVVRKESAVALSLIRDPETIASLLTLLRDIDWEVRKTAADALASIGTSAIPGLLRMLQDASNDVRRIAILVLGRLGDAMAVPALLIELKTSNTDVRAAAVHALGQIRDEEAIPELTKCLSDQSKPRWIKQTIGELALNALESIASEDAMRAIQKWQADRQNETSDSEIDSVAPDKSAAVAQSRLQEAKGTKTKKRVSRDNAQEIMKALRHKDWVVRKSAVVQLSETANLKALQLLLPLLEDVEEDVRLAVVSGLKHFPAERVLKPALQALHDDADVVSDEAVSILALVGSPAVEPLKKLLNDEDVNTRGRAVEALGKIGNPAVIPDLTRLLYDMDIPRLEDKPICDIAAEALQAIGTDEAKAALVHWRQGPEPEPKPIPEPVSSIGDVAIPFDHPFQTTSAPLPLQPEESNQTNVQMETVLDLLGRLYSNDWQEQQDAAKALNNFSKTLKNKLDNDVLERLTSALVDDSEFVRWTIVEVLGQVGDATTIPSLLQMLKDDSWTIRTTAIRALAEIGDPSAVVGLTGALTDDHAVVREAAAKVLGYFGSDKATDSLVRALADEEDFVKRAAAESLGSIGSKSVVPQLITMLSTDNPQLRWSVVEALGEIGEPTAVPELKKYLSDTYAPALIEEYEEQQRLCDVVALALNKIGTPEAIEAVKNWQEQTV